MQNHSTPRQCDDISDDLARAQLERVLASHAFGHTWRLSHFLRFIVESTTSGQGPNLKEYTIATTVFERDSDFDPRIDPIVRVQASKLRTKLAEYYASEGAHDPVVISIPKGCYVPLFERVDPATPHHDHVHASIAVLPFLNISDARENEHFCDGLTEEITQSLATVSGLRVAARTSTFRFKDQAWDVREIGSQLNVDTILEGSVRRSGMRLRIAAQLVDVTDGYQLWSQTFARELTDAFALQEGIAGAVRAAVVPHLFRAAPDVRNESEGEVSSVVAGVRLVLR